MSAIKLLINSHRSDGTFYTGQSITGTVECNFNMKKDINALILNFKGKGKTKWEESERYFDEQHQEGRYKTVDYTGKEIYLNVELTLHQGGNQTTIEAGRHTYPFSYTLPSRLPSSFVGTYGSIEYYVQAIAKRSWKTNLTSGKRILKVLSPIDLNSSPQLREPVGISLDTTMCSCCCYDSGQLTFNMSLPATGFTPGQDVSIGLHVSNMTKVTIENLKFKIVKKLVFTTRQPSKATKSEKYVISRYVEKGVGAHGDKSWTATLQIPTNGDYPNLQGCKLFYVKYQLEATVVIPFPNSNLNHKIPITIGVIPLTGISTSFVAAPPSAPPGEEVTAL